MISLAPEQRPPLSTDLFNAVGHLLDKAASNSRLPRFKAVALAKVKKSKALRPVILVIASNERYAARSGVAALSVGGLASFIQGELRALLLFTESERDLVSLILGVEPCRTYLGFDSFVAPGRVAPVLFAPQSVLLRFGANKLSAKAHGACRLSARLRQDVIDLTEKAQHVGHE